MWSLGVIAHVMLCGRPPFLAKETAQVYELITQGFDPSLAFHDSSLSPKARDLITKLLVMDPVKRLSAEEALHHSWLTGVDASTAPLTGFVLNKLQDFTSEFHLKELVLGVLATKTDLLTPSDLERLQTVLERLYEEGGTDGEITLAELRAAFKEQDATGARALSADIVQQVEDIFRLGDLAGDGRVSLRRLEGALRKLSEQSNSDCVDDESIKLALKVWE